jgi:hypothetical protein
MAGGGFTRVYLASWFETKEARHKERQDLADAGIGCTSRWLDEKPFDPENPRYAEKDATGNSGFTKFLEDTAEMDIADVIDCDVLVLFTTDKNETDRAHTGGRHFEAGFKYAMFYFSLCLRELRAPYFVKETRVITVGPRENVFHFMRSIQNFPTWPEALEWLKKTKVSIDKYDEVLKQHADAGNVLYGEQILAKTQMKGPVN